MTTAVVIIAIVVVVFIVGIIVPIFLPLGKTGITNLKTGVSTASVNSSIDSIIANWDYIPLLMVVAIFLIIIIVLIVLVIKATKGLGAH